MIYEFSDSTLFLGCPEVCFMKFWSTVFTWSKDRKVLVVVNMCTVFLKITEIIGYVLLIPYILTLRLLKQPSRATEGGLV